MRRAACGLHAPVVAAAAAGSWMLRLEQNSVNTSAVNPLVNMSACLELVNIVTFFEQNTNINLNVLDLLVLH